MKAKIKMLAMMFVAVVCCVACDDDDVWVDEAFYDSLLYQYPDAVDIEWDRRGRYYVADFWIDNHEAVAWFDTAAKWLMTDVDISWSELPLAVQGGFNSGDYSSWMPNEYHHIVYADETVQYVIEVEDGRKEKMLFYAPDGQFLKEKDVARRDDIIWP